MKGGAEEDGEEGECDECEDDEEGAEVHEDSVARDGEIVQYGRGVSWAKGVECGPPAPSPRYGPPPVEVGSCARPLPRLRSGTEYPTRPAPQAWGTTSSSAIEAVRGFQAQMSGHSVTVIVQ